MTTSAYLLSANQPPPLEGYDLFSENRPLVDAFCATRLGDKGGRVYGTLPSRVDVRAIADRHRPHIDV